MKVEYQISHFGRLCENFSEPFDRAQGERIVLNFNIMSPFVMRLIEP